jgi:4-hydroxy-2-oxoheptanedioate aldolase
MQPSHLLREARNEKLATVFKLIIPHPAIIDLCGISGFCAVWLCNEHGPNDWNDLAHCVRAARNHEMDIILRVSKGSYSDYIKPFEIDAAGIMVPHVSSAEEARRIVDMCRTFPVGNRPLDGGNSDGDYCQLPARDYIRRLNEEKTIILQIESPEGVANVEEIAAVPGYDFLMFGPGDFAHRIGRIGEIHLPEVEKARNKVEAAAARHGKMGFYTGPGTKPDDLLARGYRAVTLGSDVRVLGTSMKSLISAFHTESASGSLFRNLHQNQSSCSKTNHDRVTGT